MTRVQRVAGLGALALSGLTACGQGDEREGVTGRPEAVTNGAGWFPIGPNPITKGQTFGGTGEGLDVTGRATVIAVNPANPNEVWAGTASGGIWHTNNATAAHPVWSPGGQTERFQSLAIGAIALEGCSATQTRHCTENTNELCGCESIWVGTGENSRRRDTHMGAGVYRYASRISGEFEFYELQEVPGTAAAFKRGNVFKILPEPPSAALVLVSEGVTSNSTHSTVIAPEPDSGYGIFRVVDISGGVITPIPVPEAGTAIPSDLERRPSDNALFAAYYGVGIFLSTNGGTSWCGLNTGTGDCAGITVSGLNPTAPYFHVELTISPANPQVVYASFGRCLDRTETVCPNTTEIFRSDNGGLEWTKLLITPMPDSPRAPLESYSGYTDVLVAAPNDALRFFYGGTTMWNCLGTSLESDAVTCTGFGSAQVHPDIQDIAIAGASSNIIYAATDGGFYSSVDNGVTFTSSARSLGGVQFNSVATFTSTTAEPGAMVVGGLQDNGVVIFGGTRNWGRPVGGDGADSVLDVFQDGPDRRYLTYVTSYDGTSSFRQATGLIPSFFYLPGSDPAAPSSEAVAMYPLLEQHPGTKDLYTARQSVWKSTDTDMLRGDAWMQISPPLGDTTTPEPDIESFNNITAIGLSPNTTHVYAGNYQGQVWVSTSPCDQLSCWTQIAGPGVAPNLATIPDGPITSISVHPTDGAIAYFTISGFGTGPHVVKNTSASLTGWEDFSSGLAGEPANVIRINPDNVNEVWLGTEAGLYRSVMGSPWEREGGRFPPVPVYDIAIDPGNDRIVAGTHGRGAWIRTEPVVSTQEGWAMGTIWDIPIAGTGFLNTTNTNVPCTIELVQNDGTVCASGTKDARGGIASITPEGMLVTSNMEKYNDLQVFWGCFQGFCMNDPQIPIDHCNFVVENGVPTSEANPVTSVRVLCDGSPVGVGPVMGAPEMTAPPQNIFTLNVPGPMPLVEPGTQAFPGTGSFELAVSLQSGAGLTRQICHTKVDFDYSEPEAVILARAAEQLNEEPDCVAESVFTQFTGPIASEPDTEDDFDHAPFIQTIAPTLSGSRILVTMRVLPGSALDVCFTADDLLSRDLGQSTIMKVKPLTGPSGAEGGTLTVSERTGVGTCRRTITTTPGQTPAELAAAIVTAFDSVVLPGSADCPANANARDLAATADSVFAAYVDRFTLCTTDPGVGFVVGPEEIDLVFNKPPVAVCKDANISAGSTCTATVSRSAVDAGSFDPDGPLPDCDVIPNGPFGLGNHTVTLHCEDEQGAFDECTSLVTVVDTTPPALNCPVSVNVPCTSPNGATATFSVGATDNCGVVGTPVCSPVSGSQFPLGTRLDTCSVADTSGNPSTCNFNVTVSLGDNPVCCPAGSNVILGTSINNTLTGGTGRDCIFGRGGQDTINGNGGDDLISGGEGDDIIAGGTGNDLCFGGGGQDRLSGNAGNDVMSGGDGDDQCLGGDNNDTLLGGQGQDRLFGENHDDTLVGEIGDDHLEGGSGNDSLDGDGLHDVCIGGPGTDVFLVCESQTQ